ncbi:non-homologous end joining protein Ku [Portibacter marinus]|uniref:non-homologous end joining protein Ku n=1 Tax=Portibacter marinus TaxID=2898660 RepID=UPI001F2DD914|nr:Ku protein [Portibacter marinus]
MRSIWNGSIGFGLVTIPVKMYSGSESSRVPLDMLDSADHERIRYKRVNEKTGKEVEWKNIVKGFKTEKGYVVLEDEDFEQANIKKSKTISIEMFVDESEVAEVLYKKPYFLEPQKEGGKSYQLLLKALQKTKKLGVASFVMRNKEHLCLIGPYEEILVANMIRFQDEIRDPAELEIDVEKVNKKEVDMAISLIEQYTEPFDLTQFKDIYNEQLMKIIQQKQGGKKLKKVQFKEEVTTADKLMAKLKESIERKKSAKKAS